MASGHVNRTQRPNTWLHRPICTRKESPCQLGAVHTWPQAVTARRSGDNLKILRSKIGWARSKDPEPILIGARVVLCRARVVTVAAAAESTAAGCGRVRLQRLRASRRNQWDGMLEFLD